MNNHVNLSRALILLGMLGLPVLAMGEEEHHMHMGQELAPTPRPEELAGLSIYQLHSQWRNDLGVVSRIDSLYGRPVVLAMVYTSCEYVCPVIVEDMRAIERGLTEHERQMTTFALFSFDPKRDTPTALAAYRQQRELADENWRLFTGNPDDVLELAAVLGVNFKPDGHGGFSHTSMITVLDSQGIVRHQQVGVRQPPAPSVTVLKELLKH